MGIRGTTETTSPTAIPPDSSTAVDGKGASSPDTTALAAMLTRHEDALMGVLTGLATYDAAQDEIHRSIRALAGARWELLRNDPRQLSRLAVFLPSNNVLYSYVIFGLIPALYCDDVVIRPARRTMAVTREIDGILNLGSRSGGAITLTDRTQRAFVEVCRAADAVIFTGRYEHGRNVMAAVGPAPSFLMFGSGPNPFVIGPQAPLDAATDDLLTARLYNSGQDCLCPDVIFVHEDVVVTLLTSLSDRLSDVSITDRADPSARVAPLVYPEALHGAAQFLDEHRADIIFGIGVEPERSVVNPTVVHAVSRVGVVPPEFFSPVFYVVTYRDAAEIGDWLSSPRERARGMYACVYGEPALAAQNVVGTSVIVPNAMTFDVEDGNRPFGGYGVQASSVRHGGDLTARPVLLSKEVGRVGGRLR